MRALPFSDLWFYGTVGLAFLLGLLCVALTPTLRGRGFAGVLKGTFCFVLISFLGFGGLHHVDVTWKLRERVELRVDPLSRLDRLSLKVLEEMLVADPRIKGRFLAYLDNNKGSEREAAARLASRGNRRLDDQSLRLRNRLILQLLGQVDRKTCGDFLGGTVRTESLVPALASLDDASLEAWARLGVLASMAEMSQMPVPTATDQGVQFAFRELYSQMEGPERLRLGRHFQAIADGNTPSEEDACWASRAFYRTLEHVKSPNHATLMRLVTP